MMYKMRGDLSCLSVPCGLVLPTQEKCHIDVLYQGLIAPVWLFRYKLF